METKVCSKCNEEKKIVNLVIQNLLTMDYYIVVKNVIMNEVKFIVMKIIKKH